MIGSFFLPHDVYQVMYVTVDICGIYMTNVRNLKCYVYD